MYRTFLRFGTYTGIMAMVFAGVVYEFTRIAAIAMVFAFVCYIVADTWKIKIRLEQDMLGSLPEAIAYNFMDICLFVLSLVVALVLGYA